MDGQTGREMTFGEKAVGLTFNPDNNSEVDEIKTLYAKVIDKLNEMNKLNKMRGEDRNEKARLILVAITEAQTAQMWAIKGITWKD